MHLSKGYHNLGMTSETLDCRILKKLINLNLHIIIEVLILSAS